jgi:hypothetical protein
MKAKDVKVGERYIARVSGSLTTVRITGPNSCGGYWAVNEKTGKTVRIRSAQRLRRSLVHPGSCLCDKCRLAHHARNS